MSLNDWIDLIAFRNFLTAGQRLFLVIFYLIIGSIKIVGGILLAGLKVFVWFTGLLVGGGKK